MKRLLLGIYNQGVKKKSREPVQPKLRLRDRRRKVLQIKILVGAGLFLFALVSIFFLARLSEVTISTIEIQGTVLADQVLVKKIADDTLSGSYALLIPKKNALFVPTNEIAHAITSTFPVIMEAKVTHTSPTALSIAVTERSPAALWCLPRADATLEKCYMMDDGGFIYMNADTVNTFVRFLGVLPDNPVGSVFLKGEFPTLRAFVEEIGKTLNRVALSVSVEENKDVSVTFVGGGELKFVMTEDSAGTLENIASIFNSQKLKGKTDFEYADFRFGNKVYVKFKEE